MLNTSRVSSFTCGLRVPTIFCLVFYCGTITPCILFETNYNPLVILELFPETNSPLNIIYGFTLCTPSTKIVSRAVHCRLSRPDFAPLTQTVEELVVSHVGPWQKEKGSKVWSTLAICQIEDHLHHQQAECETLVLLLLHPREESEQYLWVIKG